jgi:hypothetical protein
MEFRIWVETRLGGSILERHRVATVERTESEIAPEEFGLSLEEGKLSSDRYKLVSFRHRPTLWELLNEHVYSASAISA